MDTQSYKELVVLIERCQNQNRGPDIHKSLIT